MSHETRIAVYTYIEDYIDRNGYAPTLREMAEGCFMSVGSLLRYLDALEAQGVIIREPRRARGMRLGRKPKFDRPHPSESEPDTD